MTDCDLRAATSSCGLWIRTLTWFGRHKLAIGIMSPPRTARLGSFGSNGQVGYMADAGESFSTEAICTDRCEILERLQF